MVDNVADCIAFERACEAYNKGIVHLLNGRFEPCILALQECIFFSHNRGNANAMVALGECYVMACDLASAVRWYHRALWVLQSSSSRSTEPQGLSLVSGQLSAQLPSAPPTINDSETATREPALMETTTHERSVSSHLSNHKDDTSEDVQIIDQDAAPGTQETGTEFTATMEREPWSREVSRSQVETRLAGLLDALSLVHYRMGDFPQALRFAEQSLALLPNQPPVCLHWCMYLIVMQQQEDAERELEKYLEEVKKAVKDNTVSPFSPYRVQIAALLVRLCCGRQAFKSARTLLEEELKVSETGLKAKSRGGDAGKEMYEAHLAIVAKQQFHEFYTDYRTKALALQDVGRISRCINVYPDDVDLLFARAQIYIRLGKLKRSVRDLFRCIKESNGTHNQAVETMTSVLFTIGQTSLADEQSCADSSAIDGASQNKSNLDEAIVYYTESLKWRVDNASVFLARGDCYLKKEDYVHALEDYKKVLELEDKLGGEISPMASAANGRIASLHNLWACKMYSMGSFREAEIEFTNAIKADSQQPVFFFHRALCRFRLQEPCYALRDVLSCHELKPTDPKLRAFVVRYLGSEDVSYLPPSLMRLPAQMHSRVARISLASKDFAAQAGRQRQKECTIAEDAEGDGQDGQCDSYALKGTGFLPPVVKSTFNRTKYLEAWRQYRQLNQKDPLVPSSFQESGDIGKQMNDNRVGIKGKQIRLCSKQFRDL